MAESAIITALVAAAAAFAVWWILRGGPCPEHRQRSSPGGYRYTKIIEDDVISREDGIE